MYRLKDGDIEYLITACRSYQYHTGSEYLWEKYETLIEKLNLYREQNLYAKGMEHSDSGALECSDT
jgi:hypothetical protein